MPRPQSANRLTLRETQCLDAYAELWSYRAVAARLGLSVHTVEMHLANVRSKLGARKTGEAIAIRAQERPA